MLSCCCRLLSCRLRLSESGSCGLLLVRRGGMLVGSRLLLLIDSLLCLRSRVSRCTIAWCGCRVRTIGRGPITSRRRGITSSRHTTIGVGRQGSRRAVCGSDWRAVGGSRHASKAPVSNVTNASSASDCDSNIIFFLLLLVVLFFNTVHTAHILLSA